MLASWLLVPLVLVSLDLGDDHAPRVLADALDLPYRTAYAALADERFDEVPDADKARDDRYLELFGIEPNLRVVRGRLLDEGRHTCHDSVDDRPLSAVSGVLRPAPDLDRAYADLRRAQTLRRLADEDAQGAFTGARGARRRARLAALEAPIAAIRAMQEHLRCDGLLGPSRRSGVFDPPTVRALAIWQRRHAIISWGVLDAESRALLELDSRELDFRTLLRVLRERVVDASGLIEDGSALGRRGTVLGRQLDEPEIRAADLEPPLEGGAPDLISAATETAARALGWTSPLRARSWLESRPDTRALKVAIDLPSPPAYHSAFMDLRVELDRGDVWLRHPGTAGARRTPAGKRPTLVLWGKAGDRWIPLMRWNTTIGGWQPTRRPDGIVALEYKGSEVGPRVWRDVMAAPAWLPPSDTPDAELMRRDPWRGWVARTDAFGPGYRSAYGLVMLVHGLQGPDGALSDHGIRTHGSASYTSILRGQSHGCHRLFNHLALRLASFLLAHRPHIARGIVPARYGRELHAHGRTMRVTIRNRGYLYQLEPPVPVEVLPGRIHGRLRGAPGSS